MSTRVKYAIAAGLIVLALALIWRPVSDWLLIDACLDAGGSLDYELRRCDFEASHPVPDRRPGPYYLGALISVLAAAFLLARKHDTPGAGSSR